MEQLQSDRELVLNLYKYFGKVFSAKIYDRHLREDAIQDTIGYFLDATAGMDLSKISAEFSLHTKVSINKWKYNQHWTTTKVKGKEYFRNNQKNFEYNVLHKEGLDNE